MASRVCSPNILANKKLIHLNSNEEELPEKNLANQPQSEPVNHLSADDVRDVVNNLNNEVRRLQVEVEYLRAGSGDTASLDDSSSRIVLKRFLNEPMNSQYSVVRPLKLHKQVEAGSNVTTSSAMNEGMSQIPAPPYELSENGRKRYTAT